MNIEILPPHVANQIAAGEVIEKPASVVKELVDNAIDAQAKSIYIDIHHGGLNRIQVSDDGLGIDKYDLPLAITAHATSKLKVLDDLYALESIGFRGEALASMSSVSHITIDSKTASESSASRLISNTQHIKVIPCARNQGTTIQVDDLFFNAPVRKKFLKSAQYEYQAIETLIKRFALAYPQVAFFLSHDETPKLALKQATCRASELQRLTKILGKPFMDHAYSINERFENMRLSGLVTDLNYARSQQDKMWFYVNKRVIRDKLLLHAFRQAYVDRIPAGKYPACALHLDLPLTEVDINVHPTKHEVRFQSPRQVHDLIHVALEKMMESTALPVQHALNSIQQQDSETSVHELDRFEPYHKIYQNKHEQGSIQPNHSSASIWKHTDGFLLVKEGSDIHVLHGAALYQAMIRQRLEHLPRPWPSRPMLVPIHLTLDEHLVSYCVDFDDVLKQFGLEITQLSPTSISILAIPQQLPHFDIHAFFSNGLFALPQSIETDLHLKLWIKALIQIESIDWLNVSIEIQNELMTFWINNKPYFSDMSVCLSQEILSSLFEKVSLL